MRPPFFLLWPALALLTAAAGCAGSGPKHVPLVLISPHRDEIREEVAIAFRDWFGQRTRANVAGAVRYVGQVNESPKDDLAFHAANQFLDQLFRDWSTADLGELPKLREEWKAEPTKDRSEALIAALKHWPGQERLAECVWQDVGGGTSQIRRFVEARFGSEPHGIGIDVLFGGGTETYERFASDGLLEPLPELLPELKDRVPAKLNGVSIYDPKARWFGPMLSSFGILCNREVLSRIGVPEPRSWSDLGDRRMRSWVNAGDPRLSGSVHVVYEVILQGAGWDDGFRSLMRLGANTHTFVRDSGTLTRSVTLGEVAAAGNVDAQALGAIEREPHMMTFILPAVEYNSAGKPSGGTIINPDAIAVLKGAPHRELARAFVEFTMSDAGQKLFLLRPGEPGGPRKHALARLSVVPGLYKQFPPDQRAVGAADPFTYTNVVDFKEGLGNSRWDALNDLIGAVIVDAHSDLAAAWRALDESHLPDDERRELEAELFRAPCSEKELAEYARRIIAEGPRARASQVNAWGEEARNRYRRVQRLARSN